MSYDDWKLRTPPEFDEPYNEEQQPMSEIVLHETSKGLEVRIGHPEDFDAPPIGLAVLSGHQAPPTEVWLTIDEAHVLAGALMNAVLEAARQEVQS